MTPEMSLSHGIDGCNNDLTAKKYVFHRLFQTKMGVRSFKRELLPLALENGRGCPPLPPPGIFFFSKKMELLRNF